MERERGRGTQREKSCDVRLSPPLTWDRQQEHEEECKQEKLEPHGEPGAEPLTEGAVLRSLKRARVGHSLGNPEQLNCSSRLSCVSQEGPRSPGHTHHFMRVQTGKPQGTRLSIFLDEARLFRVGSDFLELNCPPEALEFAFLAFAECLGTVSGHTRNQAGVAGRDRRRGGPSLPGCPWRVTFRGKLLKLSIAPVAGEGAGRSCVSSSAKGRGMQWGQTQLLSLHVTKQGRPWGHWDTQPHPALLYQCPRAHGLCSSQTHRS